MKHKKVIVGMSGGVDSSVAALLLQQQGYLIEGLFMKNWEDEDEFCSASEDAADAQMVCDKLNIPLHTCNFAEQYWQKVFNIFLSEYQAGRTPNPDILCNKEIKFRAFLDHALSLGADYIATGHYARIGKQNNSYQLLRGIDNNKDQSYFLYTLQQDQLRHSLFPIGEYEKPEIRRIANEAGFLNHNKKDSTGICFIGERKFQQFLNQFLPAQPGKMKNCQGKTIGKHQGLMYYTIGQRKGLGIGGQKDADDTPWYVLDKDLENNILIVGQGHDHPKLFKHNLQCEQMYWVDGECPQLPLQCTAKTRYRQQDCACTITNANNEILQVDFAQPHWAITPGQSIVFYQNEICLGGGIIC